MSFKSIVKILAYFSNVQGKIQDKVRDILKISKLNFLFINAFYESKVKEQTNDFALNSTVFTLQL